MQAEGQPKQREGLENLMNNDTKREPVSTSRNASFLQDPLVRRIAIYAAVLLIVFLIGLVPMWLRSRARTQERDAAQAAVRISNLQNAVANAAIDARRGEYELARQTASDFFTNLQAEIDRGPVSVFSEAQRSNLRTLFESRDDIIDLLARSDPTSADRFIPVYVRYREMSAASKR